MMRRFELRLLACILTVSMFLLLLIGNLFYPRNYNAKHHIWWCFVYVVIFVSSSYEEEFNSRYRFLQQQWALHKLERHNKTGRQSQSILNHMIKNVAIGMEDTASSLIDNKESKAFAKDFPRIIEDLQFVKSNSR